MTHVVYLGLGSNLGDSRAILSEAIEKIQSMGEVSVSRLYRSPPMGPQDQPDYLNAVLRLDTSLEPLDLLDRLQAIEQHSGRVRLRHWGERTLDLDILLYDDAQINEPRLTVPHIGMLERDFVILPLLDLVPEMQLAGRQLMTLDCVKSATATAIADIAWHHHNV